MYCLCVDAHAHTTGYNADAARPDPEPRHQQQQCSHRQQKPHRGDYNLRTAYDERLRQRRLRRQQRAADVKASLRSILSSQCRHTHCRAPPTTSTRPTAAAADTAHQHGDAMNSHPVQQVHSVPHSIEPQECPCSTDRPAEAAPIPHHHANRSTVGTPVVELVRATPSNGASLDPAYAVTPLSYPAGDGVDGPSVQAPGCCLDGSPAAGSLREGSDASPRLCSGQDAGRNWHHVGSADGPACRDGPADSRAHGCSPEHADGGACVELNPQPSAGCGQGFGRPRVAAGGSGNGTADREGISEQGCEEEIGRREEEAEQCEEWKGDVEREALELGSPSGLDYGGILHGVAVVDKNAGRREQGGAGRGQLAGSASMGGATVMAEGEQAARPASCSAGLDAEYGRRRQRAEDGAARGRITSAAVWEPGGGEDGSGAVSGAGCTCKCKCKCK